MSQQYQSRSGATSPASGGVLSSPIRGLGKLPPGKHECTVLSVREYRQYWLLLLQALDGACHSEEVVWLPPEYTKPGLAVVAEVGLTKGFVVQRSGGKYQAVTHDERRPLGDYQDTLEDVYRMAQVLGYTPSATSLVRISAKGLSAYEPAIYSPQASEPDSSQAPSTSGTK